MKQRDENDRHSQVWLEAVPLDETRSDDGTDKVLRVRGYAIVFNSESERMGNVVETIDPRSLAHLGDLLLDQAIKGAVRKQGATGWQWDPTESTADITTLIAATAALRALETMPTPEPVKVQKPMFALT